MMRTLSVLFTTLALTFSLTARAELNLDSPEQLIARASESKNHLRDVINEIDQNVTEMRDVRTFDAYFSLLDRLQELSVELKLDTIYPKAVVKLGNRMVLKGVNWLDVIASSEEKIVYYHRWMDETQPAFSFLYSAALRIKEERDYDSLKKASVNLEAALRFADEKWKDERPLRLLYRSTLSSLAAQALKIESLSETETLFWIKKLFSPEAMSEIVTFVQGEVYDIRAETKGNLHFALKRLVIINEQISQSIFGASENLVGQIGDTVVDIILKSFRFEEVLSSEEHAAAWKLMRPRHFAALANAWAVIGKIPKGHFASYYIETAHAFVQKLHAMGLPAEAVLLSNSVTGKAAAIMGRKHGIEGTWSMKDAYGKKWNLVIIYASEDLVFASFTDDDRLVTRPYYNVVYDVDYAGYIATERSHDTDSSPNLPLRFTPQKDGTLEVEDLMLPSQKPMTAKRTQTYPDLLSEGVEDGPDMNGVYEGQITIPGGKTSYAKLIVTVFNGYSVGNMTYLDGGQKTTFNYGSEAHNGVIYLTRGNNMGYGGTWMHLRGRLKKNVLKGYAIFGNSGLVPTQFELKKTK